MLGDWAQSGNIQISGLEVSDGQDEIPQYLRNVLHVLEDVYHNGTRNLEGTFYISPSEARETYLLESGKLTMVRVWFQVLRPDDMYGAMKDQKKESWKEHDIIWQLLFSRAYR
jgi:hypothetical protein